MMDANEKILNTFATRVRQMILRYESVCEENAALRRQIEERDGRIGQLEAELEKAKVDYKSLMTARMIEISDTDMEDAQKRISKLIREVNKCITLLSEK